MPQHPMRLSSSVAQALDAVAVVSQEVNALTDDAVRSLQSEDIVRQLTANSERYHDRVDRVVGRVHTVRAGLEQSEPRPRGEFAETVAVLREELDRFIAEEVEREQKPVEQELMNERDAELI